MEHNKLYEYQDLVVTSPTYYSGNLGVITNDDAHHNIISPVNKLTGDNESIAGETFIQTNTLSGATGNIKFSLSFKAHKALFTDGYRKILELDGLVGFYAVGNKLRVDKLYIGETFYISSEYLVNSGFNNISLTGDGDDIKLNVNGRIWIVNTEPSENGSYIRFSGFSDDANYITIPQFYTSDMDSFVQQVKFNMQDGIDYGNNHIGIIDSGLINYAYNTSIRLTHCPNADGRALCLRMSANGQQSYSFSIIGANALPLGTDIIGKIEFSTSAGYKLSHSVDGGINWIVDGTNNTTARPYSAQSISPFCIGDNIGAGEQYTFKGYIDFINTKFIRNGMTIFDGKKAVLEKDYKIVGTLTKNEYIVRQYPTLSVGELKTFQHSWLNLKDINAVLIEER